MRFLPWEDLPEYVRQYLFIATARTFADQILGDDSLHKFTASDEESAWVAFMDAESRNADLNVLTGSPTVQRVLRKRAG